MILRFSVVISGQLAVLFFAGCSFSGNLAKRESDTCEVHHRKMEIREVAFSQGYSGYRPNFQRGLLERFPHHGHLHFANDHGYLDVSRKGRLHVCDECNREYEKWHKEDHQGF